MTTGERIKHCRKRLGISAEKLAAMINISPSTIYRWENGDIEKVPDKVLIPLVNALQTSMLYLMGGIDDPDAQLGPDIPVEPAAPEQQEAPRISLIARGMSDMTEEQQKRFCDMARAAFPDIFGSEDSLQ